MHCHKITANTSIDVRVLQVSAPPLFDWGVSVSSYGAAILLSPNGVQILTLERLRSREGAVEDYCYVCVRPSGRQAGRANFPAPAVTWSSTCAKVNAVNNCTLVFTAEGNVALHEGVQGLWQTKTENLGVRRMELRDSGNLVLVGEGGEVVWQGFDHVPRSLGCRKEVKGGAERVRVGFRGAGL